jgi:hypothetical protein
VAAKARARGLAAPWCEAVTSLVHEVEQGRRRPAASNLNELARRALSAA